MYSCFYTFLPSNLPVISDLVDYHSGMLEFMSTESYTCHIEIVNYE